MKLMMLRDSQYKIKKYLGRAALIAALVFVLWQVSAVTKPLEAASVSISGIVLKFGAYIEERTSTLKIFFKDKQKLSDENKELADALRIALVNMFSYKELERENVELKKLLGREGGAHGILGSVLSRPNYSPYDTFLIDVGSEEGVKVGSFVVFENVLLGVVDTAYARTSKVRLFSSPGTILHVVLGNKHTPATLEGRGGGVFEIKLPRDIEIKEGDNALYPMLQNYLLGIVSAIELKPSSSFQTISFRAPINIFTARFVVVMPDIILSTKVE